MWSSIGRYPPCVQCSTFTDNERAIAEAQSNASAEALEKTSDTDSKHPEVHFVSTFLFWIIFPPLVLSQMYCVIHMKFILYGQREAFKLSNVQQGKQTIESHRNNAHSRSTAHKNMTEKDTCANLAWALHWTCMKKDSKFTRIYNALHKLQTSKCDLRTFVFKFTVKSKRKHI